MTSSDKWQARFRGSDWRKARDTTANSPRNIKREARTSTHSVGNSCIYLAKQEIVPRRQHHDYSS